jgi:hypothetical protein
MSLSLIPLEQRTKIEKLLYFAANVGTGTHEEADCARRLAEKLCAQWSVHTSDFGSDTFKRDLQQKAADYTTNFHTYHCSWVLEDLAELYGFNFEYYNNKQFIFKNSKETTYIAINAQGVWTHYNEFGQIIKQSKFPGDLLWHLKTRPDKTLMHASESRKIEPIDCRFNSVPSSDNIFQ